METTQRDSRGWRVDIGEFYIGANQQGRGRIVDVNIDENGLGITIDEGSGYDRCSCTAAIPIEHLRAMLAAFDAQQAVLAVQNTVET
jgi:hypothetical protein